MSEPLRETKVIDEAEQDTLSRPIRYDITNFGADYDVEGLVRRLQRGDIYIPDFQRDYVWSYAEASRLIESLLLGLPIPGVFLAREAQTNKLLVVDGQQRLKTLQFFYDGYFNPNPDDKQRKVFKLYKVQPEFEDLTYQELDDKDRLRLDDSIIHATIIKQENPADGDTSVYHIFERLNNGGRKLTPQEIRVAIYHGPFMDMVKRLNDLSEWRDVFGKRNPRLKDQELIVRFLGLYFYAGQYERPMKEFLNVFCQKHQNPNNDFIEECETIFSETMKTIKRCQGNNAFRPERALNAAVFDSVMYGVAKKIVPREDRTIDCGKFRAAYANLLKDEEYIQAVSKATSNESNVIQRLTKALEAFSSV